MKIDIKQHGASLSDGYEIYKNGKREFSAYTEILTFSPTLKLSEYGSDRPILSIEKSIWPFGIGYFITKNNKDYLFTSVGWFKKHFKCTVGDLTYNIFGHSNNRYSVYKGDIQIAYWTGQAVTFLEGDVYQIHADNSADAKLLISFCLIIDHYYYNNSGLLSINFGKIGSEVKKFNHDWTPKI